MAHDVSGFSLRSRLRSFLHAGRGIGIMVQSQHNARIHGLATLIVVSLGIALRVDRVDWAILIVAVMMVWTAEALNTALEFLADVASPDFHPLVQKAKDVAAGAVLVTALGAVAIGGLILGPALVRCL